MSCGGGLERGTLVTGGVRKLGDGLLALLAEALVYGLSLSRDTREGGGARRL